MKISIIVDEISVYLFLHISIFIMNVILAFILGSEPLRIVTSIQEEELTIIHFCKTVFS